MRWQKKGLVYSPSGKEGWNNKYGMMPTPVLMENDNIIRVYFGVTDAANNGRTTYLDLDADNLAVIRQHAGSVVLDTGQPGTFDDCGAVPSSIIDTPEGRRLYYVGFQRCEKVPYMLFSGLAIESTDGSFVRYSQAPVIDRSKDNYISNAAPFVLKDGDRYKMWYWVGREWIELNNKKYIRADISYAESADGIKWEQSGIPCITIDPAREFSVGRPWVIKENGKYKMFYSVRYVDRLYRLGYAESPDGRTWIRKDGEIGIDVSADGWDSEMICYPAVISIKQKTYLFYNGNNNGATGFGYAELVDDRSSITGQDDKRC